MSLRWTARKDYWMETINQGSMEKGFARKIFCFKPNSNKEKEFIKKSAKHIFVMDKD